MNEPIATFQGIQPACIDMPRYELWKLTRAVEGHAAGRVWPRATIEDLGHKLPDRTPAPANT